MEAARVSKRFFDAVHALAFSNRRMILKPEFISNTR